MIYKWPISTISLVIREMQIKTTMKCHFMLVRMAIIKKAQEEFLS